MVLEFGAQGTPVVVGEEPVAQLAAARGSRRRGRRTRQPSARSDALVILPVAVSGRPGDMRTKRGGHLVPRSGWAPRKAAKPSGSKRRAGAQLHRGHDLVPGAGVGHGVDRGGGDVGVALDDPLDRARRRSSRSRPAASPRRVRRSRSSRLRRGTRGRRTSTSRCAPARRRRRGSCSSPRSPAPRCG